jgi:histone H3/H4
MSGAEDEKERKLPSQRVKRILRTEMGEGNMMGIGGSASELVTDVGTEFVQMIALAALDRSDHPKRYVNSSGIVRALIDLGFPEIAEALPDLSVYTEDMQPR